MKLSKAAVCCAWSIITSLSRESGRVTVRLPAIFCCGVDPLPQRRHPPKKDKNYSPLTLFCPRGKDPNFVSFHGRRGRVTTWERSSYTAQLGLALKLLSGLFLREVFAVVLTQAAEAVSMHTLIGKVTSSLTGPGQRGGNSEGSQYR